MIICVACQRRLEPGQRRDRPIAGADDLGLQRERDGIAGREALRTARGIRRGGDLAGVEADAAEIGPGGGVAGSNRQMAGERLYAAATVALHRQRAGTGADRVAVTRRGERRGVDRALQVGLEDARLRPQAGDRGRRDAQGAGAAQRPLRRDAVAEPQIGAGEQQQRRLRPWRSGERGERMIARGAVIADAKGGPCITQRDDGIGARGGTQREPGHGGGREQQHGERDHLPPAQPRPCDPAAAAPAVQQRVAPLSHADRSS
jgi:hypothetical protein